MSESHLPEQVKTALAQARAHASRWNPRMAELHARLLREGGREVLFEYPEPDIDELVETGWRFSHRVQGYPGSEPRGCHRNVVALWKKEPARFRIATGYGLNPYGIWMQHSWLVDEALCIYETTTYFFEAYFGIVYSEEQASRFARDVPPPG